MMKSNSLSVMVLLPVTYCGSAFIGYGYMSRLWSEVVLSLVHVLCCEMAGQLHVVSEYRCPHL